MNECNTMYELHCKSEFERLHREQHAILETVGKIEERLFSGNGNPWSVRLDRLENQARVVGVVLKGLFGVVVCGLLLRLAWWVVGLG